MFRLFKTRFAFARSLFPILGFAFLFVGAVSIRAQSIDHRIAVDSRVIGIEQVVTQVNEQIAQSESQGEYSSIFRTELVVNQRENPWPAVGIYQRTVRFYFTYGDREKDPYPNRLLKITVTTKRSSRHEYEEYVLNPSEQLVFAKFGEEDDPAIERKYYFARDLLVGAMAGQKQVNVKLRATIDRARSALKANQKLVAIFRNSLE